MDSGRNLLRVVALLTASLPFAALFILCVRNGGVLLLAWLERSRALAPEELATLGLILLAHLLAAAFALCALHRFWTRYDRLLVAVAAASFGAVLFLCAFCLTFHRPEPGWIGWMIGIKVYWYLLPVYLAGCLCAGVLFDRCLMRRTLAPAA